MKLVEMNSEQVAQILFDHDETEKKVEFYISLNPITNAGEGACLLKVISIADDVTIVGNYYGGGLPFLYDMTRDEEPTELAAALHDYFEDIGAGGEVYVEVEDEDKMPIGN